MASEANGHLHQVSSVLGWSHLGDSIKAQGSLKCNYLRIIESPNVNYFVFRGCKNNYTNSEII